jgi:hypothetical protein
MPATMIQCSDAAMNPYRDLLLSHCMKLASLQIQVALSA